jgi:LmbE family N-acetylglucosaminyl deacetylase
MACVRLVLETVAVADSASPALLVGPRHPAEAMLVMPPRADSIAAIAAHPDDIESWCAGTLARAIDGGATVRLLLVTSGDKGSRDPDADPAAVATQREAESLAAAAHLGIADVAFLRYPDGEIEDTRALRREVVAWLRRWRPAVLFTHDPEHPYPPYLSHRDHRIVGRVALDAVYPFARDPLSFPELAAARLAPHAVREVWLFASAAATAYVDIGAGFARKIAARLAHASQTPDPAALPASWRGRDSRVGAAVGVPLAEAFTVLRLD